MKKHLGKTLAVGGAIIGALVLGVAVKAQSAASPAEQTAKPADQARQAPPPPEPIRPFEFPKFQTKKLGNGLTVYVVEDHRQPLVSYTLVVNAGGIAHAPAKAGLASLTAALLTQGTTTRSAQQIAQAIDSVGGDLSASADDDVARVSATVMRSSVDLAVDLLADVVLRPAFAQEEIDRQLQQTLSNLQIQYTDPEYLAPVVAARAVLGDHPYAYPIDGTPETLPTLTRAEIVAFHKERYVPAGASLAVAGDITPDVAFAQIEKRFDDWKGSAAAGSPAGAPAAPQRTVLIIDKPDAVQTQIVVGGLGIRRNDPDYLPLSVANRIFGGSFNSRLNLKLRAQEGLTYGASSVLNTEREAGAFIISTFTRTEETAKAVGMLMDLLRDFRSNPVTEAELKETKAYMVGSFAIGSETPGQVAGRVLSTAIFGLPVDYWDKYRDDVQRVTAADVTRAVERRIDPSQMVIVVVGNAAGFAEGLKSLGPSRTIHFSDLDVLQPGLTKKVAE